MKIRGPTLNCVHCGQRATLAKFRGPYNVPMSLRCRNPRCGKDTLTVVWCDVPDGTFWKPTSPPSPAGTLFLLVYLPISLDPQKLVLHVVPMGRSRITARTHENAKPNKLGEQM